MKQCNVAVIGLGILGSAVVYEASRRLTGVVGLDRYWSVHDQGSSYGHTRLFRRVHFEHPGYVPLAERAFSGWTELAARCDRTLFVETGAVVIGPAGSAMVENARAAGRAHGIPREELTNAQLRKLLPWISPSDEDVAVAEPSAGVLLAEECVSAFQQGAVREGAELRFGADCEIEDLGSESRPLVLSVKGERLVAERVVVAAGPWSARLLPEPWIPRLDVERVASYWFEPRFRASSFDPTSFPVTMWDHPLRPFICFPQVAGPGVKVGFHHGGELVDPDRLGRAVSAEEILAARSQLDQAMPAVAGPLRRAATCMYTNTRDGHFAVGFAGPGDRVVLASACSGHGFKFAPLVGRIVADLLERGDTEQPMDLFRLDRAGLYGASDFHQIEPRGAPARRGRGRAKEAG